MSDILVIVDSQFPQAFLNEFESNVRKQYSLSVSQCFIDDFESVIPFIPKILDKKLFGQHYGVKKEMTTIPNLNDYSTIINLTFKNFEINSEKSIGFNKILGQGQLYGNPREWFFNVNINYEGHSFSIKSSIRTHYSAYLTYQRMVRTALGISLISLGKSKSSLRGLSSQSSRRLNSVDQGKFKKGSYLIAIVKRYLKKKTELEMWGFGVGSLDHWKMSATDVYVPKNRDRIWADPHIAFRENRYFVFLEEMMNNYNVGYIVCLELSKELEFIKRYPCIKESFHMSYPQLFEYKDELYMMPETSENKTVSIYKCLQFPNKWEKVLDVWDNVNAKDTTLFEKDNVYYLISTIETNYGEGLGNNTRVFTSSNPISKNWTECDLSPVSFTVGNSRSAGPIFEKDGQTIRPVQNGSKRYGYGLNYNRIVDISTKGMTQELIGSDLPPAFASSIHSFAMVNNFAFFDFVYTKFPLNTHKCTVHQLDLNEIE
jgi:hypothetical protein